MSHFKQLWVLDAIERARVARVGNTWRYRKKPKRLTDAMVDRAVMTGMVKPSPRGILKKTPLGQFASEHWGLFKSLPVTYDDSHAGHRWLVHNGLAGPERGILKPRPKGKRYGKDVERTNG